MNNFKLALFLASKSILRTDKWSLALVIIVMLIVFVNLLFTDAVFSGITHSINANKINYQFGELIIEPAPSERFIKETAKIVNFLHQDFRVKSVEYFLDAGAVFKNKKAKDGRDDEQIASLIVGVHTNEDTFNYRNKIIDGNFLSSDAFGEIVLGKGLSGGYGLGVFPDDLDGMKPGDSVYVGIDGSERKFKIIGILGTKNFTIDRYAFVKYDDLAKLFGVEGLSTKIVVRLFDKNQARALKQDLKLAGFNVYKIQDWQEKIAFGASINKSFEMIGSILRFIGALLAGLVIFIVIFVDILNKRRQIGIFKAIGIPDSVIILSYILRGLFYSLIGVIAGYLLMQYVIIAGFKSHPIPMPMADVVPLLKAKALEMSAIFFVLAGFIGSFVPAIKEIRKHVLILLYK